MPRIKRLNGTKTSIEIVKIEVVLEKCHRTGETLKDYINRLINEDMMGSDEDISIMYFKVPIH